MTFDTTHVMFISWAHICMGDGSAVLAVLNNFLSAKSFGVRLIPRFMRTYTYKPNYSKKSVKSFGVVGSWMSSLL